MKTILFSSMLLLMLSACQEKPSGTQAIVSDQQEAKTPADGDHYPIDATKSWLHFTGTKPVGTHTAEIKFSEGEFILADQKITGGQFKADLTQLKSLDQDTAYSYKLLAHLQSPDFFDIQKFPTAQFQLISCEEKAQADGNTHMVTGNLTLKDSTRSITFPAKIQFSKESFQAQAEFVIDRTLWGLHYGNDKSLKDKFIYPEVKIALDLTAAKS